MTLAEKMKDDEEVVTEAGTQADPGTFTLTHDASGESTDEARVRFKLSQAVWASRYEVTHGRKLQAADELIRVEVKPKALD